jgi:phage shock protein A
MPEERKTDLLSKLAELSEEAMHRLQEAPGGERVVGALNSMRDRVDELQKRVRGLDELERRLAELEHRVDELAKDGGGSSKGRKTTKSS